MGISESVMDVIFRVQFRTQLNLKSSISDSRWASVKVSWMSFLGVSRSSDRYLGNQKADLNCPSCINSTTVYNSETAIGLRRMLKVERVVQIKALCIPILLVPAHMTAIP